jgi:hypothetical protein
MLCSGHAVFGGFGAGLGVFQLRNLRWRSAAGLLRRPFGGDVFVGRVFGMVSKTLLAAVLGTYFGNYWHLKKNFSKNRYFFEKNICIWQKNEYNKMEETWALPNYPRRTA